MTSRRRYSRVRPWCGWVRPSSASERSDSSLVSRFWLTYAATRNEERETSHPLPMKVTFIGGGNMASAIIGGLLAAENAVVSPSDIRVVEIDSAARERLGARFGVRSFQETGSQALEN